MTHEQALEGGEHRRRVAVVEDGGGEVERAAERVRCTNEGRGALPIGRGGGEREGRVRAQVCEGGGLLESAEERKVGRGDERILCELTLKTPNAHDERHKEHEQREHQEQVHGHPSDSTARRTRCARRAHEEVGDAHGADV